MSARLLEVVEGLGLAPGDRVLEVGCGHGVGRRTMCERLDGGRYTAIDRSAKMIEAAAKHNARFPFAEFLVMELEALDLGERRFDVVFAVSVRQFGRTLVEPRLAPGARVDAVYDSPG